MKTYLEAKIWWCGDDICDCHQPQIDLCYPNPHNSRFILRKEIWRGRFGCEGDMEGMYEELIAAAQERNIILDSDLYGTKKQ